MSWKLHLLGKGEPDLSRTSPAWHRQQTWSLGHRVPQQWRLPCWSTQQRCTRWGRLQTFEAEVDFSANFFPFWIRPISGIKKACFGCRSLCFQGRLYSTTLTGQPSEHWHFWILSTLAPRKGLDGEITKPFGTSFSLWWVWLTTRWYALGALSSWNNPYSLAFCGSLSSWMRGGHDFTRSTFGHFQRLKCFLAGENSFVLWGCDEPCLMVPLFTLPLLGAFVQCH